MQSQRSGKNRSLQIDWRGARAAVGVVTFFLGRGKFFGFFLVLGFFVV